jgi:hypothetical protein
MAAARPTPAAKPSPAPPAKPAKKEPAPAQPNEDGVLVIDEAEDPAAILERMGRR